MSPSPHPVRPPEPPARPAPRHVLELPVLHDEHVGGGRFVARAVALTLGVMGLLAAASMVAGVTVWMDLVVTAPGELEPGRVWPVRTRETGVVEQVLVRAGDTVAAGAPVARLDSVGPAAALRQLEAQARTHDLAILGLRAAAPLEAREQAEARAAAQTRVVQARATLLQRAVEHDLGRNLDSLLIRHVPGSHVALDLAVSEVRAAESAARAAQVRGDRSALHELDVRREEEALRHLEEQIAAARERIQRLSVAAPAAGVVLTREPERLTGALVREGETLLEVADLGSWRVRLRVPERDVHRIRPGDPAKLEIQAFRHTDRMPLRGRVETVAAGPLEGSAEIPGGGVYEVVVRLDPEEVAAAGTDNLRRGFSVIGNIVLGRERMIVVAWRRLSNFREKKR
jgi:multidrug resistance efflux pump